MRNHIDDVLIVADFACNSVVHDSAGRIPFASNHGQLLLTPEDRAVGDKVSTANNFVGAKHKATKDARAIQ